MATNIRDINPLEHLTSDMAKSRYNYESMLNGIVEWNNSKLDKVTVRLATDVEPFFVDYTFPTRRGYADNSAGIASSSSSEGEFSIGDAYDIPALYDPSADRCDTIKMRIKYVNGAGASWSMYANVVIYDDAGTTASRNYTQELYVRRVIDGSAVLCRTTTAVAKGDAWSASPVSSDSESNWMYAVEAYDPNKLEYYTTVDDVMVSYNGSVYRVSGNVEQMLAPSTDGSGWTKVCDMLGGMSMVLSNHIYYHDGEFYLYTAGNASVADILMPDEDSDGLYWQQPSVFYKYLFAVTGSVAQRLNVPTDISGFLLRMDSESTDGTTPDIEMVATREINAGTEQDYTHKGIQIFDTSNYSLWPSSDNSIWTSGSIYSTDTSIPATSTQEYTAKMVFHHSDADIKSMNIVNYDGPDLDQGLAIYLPVRDKVIVNGIETYKYPCDGYTFEFLFRIWPNPAYNGNTTADLIINKAHIYVYSVDTSDTLTGSAPIAKFSMARLTNFYVFAENIGVPNRPVLYKAKFVYSASKETWETYDYYQLPDHIFLSPKGFVDPSDRSSDTYGVETAGFPLFQDPFSGYDLSRIMVDSEYLNRME